MIGPNVHDIGFLIRLIHDAIDRTLNNQLRSSRLTHSQIIVLAFLRSREGVPTSITDIQRFMNVSHPTVAGLVKRLEKKGLVYVLVDPTDKRARIVKLNVETNDLYEKDEPPIAPVEERLLKGFSKEERQQLQELLTRVYHNICW